MNALNYGVNRSQFKVTVEGRITYAATITVQAKAYSILDVSCRVRLLARQYCDYGAHLTVKQSGLAL